MCVTAVMSIDGKQERSSQRERKEIEKYSM